MKIELISLPNVAEPIAGLEQTPAGRVVSPPSPPLSLDELAVWLRVPKSTLYKYLSEGMRTVGVKVGKQWRFQVEEVWEWLKGRERHKQRTAAAKKHAFLEERDDIARALARVIPSRHLRPVLRRRRREQAVTPPSATC